MAEISVAGHAQFRSVPGHAIQDKVLIALSDSLKLSRTYILTVNRKCQL